MRIKIENTGIIQRANVKLSGLNIIGGDNDTGKSTVGKLIFAIVKAVSDIQNSNDTHLNKIDKIFKALRRTLSAEFHGDISPKNPKKISFVEIINTDESILGFFIENDDIKTLKATEKLSFDDVTFIETPMIMQMSDLIRNATTILDLYDLDKSQRLNNFAKPKVPLHTKDLMTKLENAHYFANPMLPKEPTQYIELQEKIATIINGSFVFDPQDKEFAFAKKTGKKNQSTIKAVNTASGVKSFGLIQMLLQTGILDHRSLIVIDEPETHLHPKWQLEYAKILIELVKNDISVLVASHSPYFIQALKVFSEREGIKDKTNFYLSERNEKTGFVTINEVTKDLNKLFATLAAPLKELL